MFRSDSTTSIGEDGSTQVIVTAPGDGGVDRWVETRVGRVVFRSIRRGAQFVGFEMIEGSRKCPGRWDPIQIRIDGGSSTTDYSSYISTFYRSPDRYYLYRGIKITHGVRAAMLNHVRGNRLDRTSLGASASTKL